MRDAAAMGQRRGGVDDGDCDGGGGGDGDGDGDGDDPPTTSSSRRIVMVSMVTCVVKTTKVLLEWP